MYISICHSDRNQSEFSIKVYGDWIDMDSHLDVAEVPTEEEICNAVMNPRTFKSSDEEENSVASSKEIVEL
jgi:hypothetical protein